MNYQIFRSLMDGHTYAIFYAGRIHWQMVTEFCIVGRCLVQVHVN